MLILLLFVLLILPVRADEFQALFPDDTVSNVHQAENWCVLTVTYASEGAGMAILRKFDGKWVVLLSGGGALGPRELYTTGAPPRLWRQLISGWPEPDYADAKKPRRSWPECSERQLTEDDLSSRSAWELTMMRNEIFARRGRPFQDAYLKEYFATRGWYRPDKSYSDARLTPLEKRNAELIAAYQKRTGKQF